MYLRVGAEVRAIVEYPHRLNVHVQQPILHWYLFSNVSIRRPAIFLRPRFQSHASRENI
jgi:hypothetical protein